MPFLLIAIILGIVEGVTEFLPVSSTGHLILATELLGFDAEKWAAFNVIIQLGAILAIVVLYWRTFWAVLEGCSRRTRVVRFVRNILIGFLPSAVLGFLLIKHIEALLGNAEIVAVALIVGGIAILVIERMVKRADDGRRRRTCRSSTAHRRRPRPVPRDDPGRQPLGRDDHGRAVARRRTAHCGRVQLLPRDPDDARRHGADWSSTATSSGAARAASAGTVAVGFVVSFLVALVVIRAFVLTFRATASRRSHGTGSLPERQRSPGSRCGH